MTTDDAETETISFLQPVPPSMLADSELLDIMRGHVHYRLTREGCTDIVIEPEPYYQPPTKLGEYEMAEMYAIKGTGKRRRI